MESHVPLKREEEEEMVVDAVIFEGGGAKVVAYVGAAQVLEEKGLLKGITKFAGTSGGALIAAMLAMKIPVKDIEAAIRSQKSDWILDAAYSYFSALPNLFWKFGWNPSKKVNDEIRLVLNKRYDEYLETNRKSFPATEFKPKGEKGDITFKDIYKVFNTELCVVSSNLTTRSVQYHHPKTTPEMSVVSALRASISLPLLCQPVLNGRGEYLVDGGVMCNYPIHAFDGWFLSMKKEDSYFKKVNSFDSTAFGEVNKSTIGFVVNEASENDLLSDQLSGVEVDKIDFPGTTLYKKRKEWLDLRIEAHKKQKDVRAASLKLYEVLARADKSGDGKVSRAEFKSALEEGKLTNEFELIFGPKVKDTDAFVKAMDINGDGEISFNELLMSMKEKCVLFEPLLGRSNPQDADTGGLLSFIYSILDTITGYTQLVTFKKDDVIRTCKINVWYIKTQDFELETKDQDFLITQGRQSCLNYIKKRFK